MTDLEYEDAYQEVLRCLGEASSIGTPYFEDSERTCLIDGVPLSDNQIFERLWGPGIAARIKRERE